MNAIRLMCAVSNVYNTYIYINACIYTIYTIETYIEYIDDPLPRTEVEEEPAQRGEGHQVDVRGVECI